MKTSSYQNAEIIFFLTVLGIALVVLLEKSSPAQTKNSRAEQRPANILIGEQTKGLAQSKAQHSIAPFIVRDTSSDSPGTNIVTRIVTITAEVDGTQPVGLQWKVDKGYGFVAIPGATNASFRIGNAQVADSGLYSLFASNSVGNTNTTPVPLIVIEGED